MKGQTLGSPTILDDQVPICKNWLQDAMKRKKWTSPGFANHYIWGLLTEDSSGKQQSQVYTWIRDRFLTNVQNAILYLANTEDFKYLPGADRTDLQFIKIHVLP